MFYIDSSLIIVYMPVQSSHPFFKYLTLALVIVIACTLSAGCTSVSSTDSDICIGIVGAMGDETNDLIAHLQDVTKEETTAGTFCSGTYNGVTYVVGTSNMGKVYATMTTQWMIACYHPDCIINIGVGGAVSEILQVGDVVVASSAFQHDYDVSPLGRDTCYLYERNMMYIPADTSLNAVLKTCGEKLNMRTVEGICATGDQFVEDLDVKNRLNNDYDAIVCDMEGAAILLVCYENGVPGAECRIISDTLYGNHEEYDENLTVQGGELARLMLQLSDEKDALRAALNLV